MKRADGLMAKRISNSVARWKRTSMKENHTAKRTRAWPISLCASVLMLCLPATATAAERGIASTYCDPVTSIGPMNCSERTVAHRTLPYGSKVLVHNLWNRKWTIATVTDRGMMCDACEPEMKKRVRGRILDMSTGTAVAVGSTGLTLVVVIPLPKVAREI